MARLDDRWILKGGYALQLRTEKARTTQDVDLLAQEIAEDQISETLLDALHQDAGDYFKFFIERSNLNLDAGSAIRFRMISRVAGRVFKRFHIDVGYGDPIVEAVDYLTPPNYLAFAEVDSPAIPCYPVSQHIVEKLHALVRLRSTENSRVKDFVDILLFASMDTNLQADHLSATIQAVFATRGDALPIQFGQIHLSWESKHSRFAKNLELPFTDF
ncbi:MAG: nucleotidyl transferase AbiEii/AbiGii toxin family protein [Chloroflexi bacterium]|nr:nucleotidyl transferase AbiEii/AbiGii toxin family protein [Chloroflexota bacterium]